MRLDKFLKVSRIIKRRTVAKEACDKGIVTINGKVAKSSSEVNIGDLLEIQFGEKKMKFKINEIREHSITLKDRSSLHISGIEHIYSFNDKKVELRTSAGEMVIEGENLDMGKLSLDESIITVEGTINSIVYSKERKPQESFIKRLFK